MTLLQYVGGKLNSINNKLTNLVVNNVDEETGEISDSIMDELEGLELKKEEITKVIGVSYQAYERLAKAIESDPVVQEAKEKIELAKRYRSTSQSFKNMLSKIVPEGLIVENDEFRVSWRKSTVVEVDDFDFDINELEKTNPELVKVTKSLNKAEAKKLNVLPKGLKLISKNNIQVK